MKVFFCFFILYFSIWLTGCSSGGIVLRETPLNVSETRKGIVAVIGEPRSVSENGREIFSKYYDKKGKEILKMNMVRERFTTHVTILGDRRPYDVQVEVLRDERLADGNFEFIDRDDNKASPIAESIQKYLHQSRDGRNIIDDFRSF